MLSHCKVKHLLPIRHRCGWVLQHGPKMKCRRWSLASHSSGASRQSSNRGHGTSNDTSHPPSSHCGPDSDWVLRFGSIILVHPPTGSLEISSTFRPSLQNREVNLKGWKGEEFYLQCTLRTSPTSHLFQEWLVYLPCKMKG